MATFSELWTLLEDPVLKEKVASACVVAANSIQNESDATANHANRLKWAKGVFQNPVRAGDDLLKAVLGANASQPVDTIRNASDSVIQNAVDAAVDIFADGST